jgi:serine/threonine protein kinase
MGEVYLAENAQLRRRVALKILPSELAANQNRMRRFMSRGAICSSTQSSCNHSIDPNCAGHKATFTAPAS